MPIISCFIREAHETTRIEKQEFNSKYKNKHLNLAIVLVKYQTSVLIIDSDGQGKQSYSVVD